MSNFFNRHQELIELNQLIEEPEAQLVMVYGRRRIGKTTLLTRWAEQTGLPTFYWVAKRDPKEVLQANLAQAVYAWEHNLEYADTAIRPDDWEVVLRMLARAIGNKRAIVILDELPYALEQDTGLGSHLQAAWDHLFKDGQVLLFLSGSHIGMLTDLTRYQSPLYGRLTAQFPLTPLTFKNIQAFLPHCNWQKRLAVYAILGGVPAYLERWRDKQTIAQNVERLFLQRTGWFRNEPLVLISDLTQREATKYEAILKAIANGRTSREDIAAFTATPSSSLSHYLPRLIDLQFVEKRVPATVPLKQIKTSKHSRYHLRDSFLRFYYRFVDPNLHLIEQGLTHHLWQTINRQLRPFVAYTFEALCRQWVIDQTQQEQLPFIPENVGSHWSAQVQIDVVAISWSEKQILLGECKWGDRPISRSIIRELIEEKRDKVLNDLPDKGIGWTVHYAFFAREAFTSAAQETAQKHQAGLYTLKDIVKT
ncbi:MAG: ATP-binding protein, partial [Chloroflexi bacterium]|nr:ATP-binding protein [Chloroflexota bacterium]